MMSKAAIDRHLA